MPVRQRRDSLQSAFLEEPNGSDVSVRSETDNDWESRPRSLVEDGAGNEKEVSLGYLLTLTCGVGGCVPPQSHMCQVPELILALVYR